MAYVFSEEILSFMNDHIIPGNVADNIGDQSPGLALFLSSGRTNAENGRIMPRTNDELLEGAKYIRRPTRFARTVSRGSFEGRDVLSTVPNRKYDAFRERMFSYFVPIDWTWDDKLINRGKESFVNKMEQDVIGASSDMMDLLATGIYNSAASRTGMQAKGIYGLRVLCNIDRTWMSVDSTTYTWADAGFNSNAYTIAELTDPDSDNFILKLLRTAQQSISLMGKSPNYILTSFAIWNMIEDAMMNKHLGGNVAGRGSFGFTSLNYKGMEIYADRYCPDYHLFMLTFEGKGNERTLGIKGRRDGWFYLTQEQRAHNQLVWTQYMLTQCMMYCDKPRLQFGYTDLGQT
jgi:hypothetical protein